MTRRKKRPFQIINNAKFDIDINKPLGEWYKPFTHPVTQDDVYFRNTICQGENGQGEKFSYSSQFVFVIKNQLIATLFRTEIGNQILQKLISDARENLLRYESQLLYWQVNVLGYEPKPSEKIGHTSIPFEVRVQHFIAQRPQENGTMEVEFSFNEKSEDGFWWVDSLQEQLGSEVLENIKQETGLLGYKK